MMNQQQLIEFLDRFFQVEQYPEEERGGIYQKSDCSIRRLGLALEPFPELDTWITKHRIDAMFIHRPWQLDPEVLPPDMGVIFYHLPFDERLTLGFNLRLAEALSMVNVQPFGQKAERTIGMIGEISVQPFDHYCAQVRQVFGGYDSAIGDADSVTKIAIVGAMNESLIRRAADQGANVYITGQYRISAKDAVLETGIRVIAVGHRRCEQWGLRALSAVLRERWSNLQTVLAKGR